MLKFAIFDPQLNLKRLPLVYSLGDLSSVREIFTAEPGDIGRTQLPILPTQMEIVSHNGHEFPGYLVEGSSTLLVAIREFLSDLIVNQQIPTPSDLQPVQYDAQVIHEYSTEVKRLCINRIGSRLLDVIKQDRRLGLYNLFWLVISKYIMTLLDQLVPSPNSRRLVVRMTLQPILMQTLQQVLQRVRSRLHKEDKAYRQYSQYINDTLTAHLGGTFNYEFSHAIIADQIHMVVPQMSRQNVLACAKAVFTRQNEKYVITYHDFLKIYSGVRSYIEGRLRKGDAGFCEMIANMFTIPTRTVQSLPVEMIIFHPTIISLFAEEIKGLPAYPRKKSFFRNWSAQLGDEFGEDSWDFAMNDYFMFAKDLRRSEMINFFRDRIIFTKASRTPTLSTTGRHRVEKPSAHGIVDKVSYQFEKGRIVNDLRAVSLIFLDLRGFTEISAGDITDQELQEHLYRFFDPVVNILNHFGGTIKNYAGDAILAAFGADSTYNNHALDAVRSAVEIHRFFTLLKRESRTPFKSMGIGIHSGLVEEAYFFLDSVAPSHNTVVGLAANVVGRLSSGKAEKKKVLDPQTTSSLLQNLMTSPNLDLSLIANIQDVLRQVFEKQTTPGDGGSFAQALSVKVVQGILNNQGIAISGGKHGTFERIRASVELKEIETGHQVYYSYFDNVLREQLVFIKAGDASLKGIDTGIQKKFPVWGVYLERDLPGSSL